MSEKNNLCTELVFTQNANTRRRLKIKELWKLLDDQCNLQPYKPSRRISRKDVDVPDAHEMSSVFLKTSTSKSITSSSSSESEISEEQMIWYDGLQFFQKVGLDKTAITASYKCKLCQREEQLKSSDYADTVLQTYDELNEEIMSYDKRLADRESNNANSTKQE